MGIPCVHVFCEFRRVVSETLDLMLHLVTGSGSNGHIWNSLHTSEFDTYRVGRF